MKKKKKIIIAIVSVCLLLTVSAVGIKAFAGVSANDNLICKGVFINNIDVSDMTFEQATKAVEEHILDVRSKKVAVNVDGNWVETTVGALGGEIQIENTVETAISYGKSGNFIKRYKDLKDVQQQPLVLPLELKVQKDKIKSFVETECTVYDVPAENATLTKQNGKFVVTDHKSGRKLTVEDTIEQIETELTENWSFNDIEIEGKVVVDEPEYTSEKLADCTDLLGTFSTTYSSSSSSRANNLANGARLLNGNVIWPGETFSAGKTLQPITAENGYSMAAAYENGQVVDSIGGGVCQVTTTFYNALLNAELEIVERSNHSMIVGYVKPSMDAAIAGDYKDLKFKNNTDTPVYLEATTVGRTIVFNIYGHETRDLVNRKVEYESKVLEVIQPGKEKVFEDKTKPSTYRQVTQAAHTGYRAELWKVIYENGVEVSREKVNQSTYAATPVYVTVGAKAEKPIESEKPEEDKEEPEIDLGEVEDPADIIETQKPQATEKPSDKPKPTSKPIETAKPTEKPTPTPSDEPQDEIEDNIEDDIPPSDNSKENQNDEIDDEPVG